MNHFNLDQATLTHIAIGAGIMFAVLRFYLSWGPGKREQGTGNRVQQTTTTTAFVTTAPAPGQVATYDIPNLPLKAVVTFAPKEDAK